MSVRWPIISIDPSLTCVGYAVWFAVDTCIDGGLIRPSKPKAPASERVIEICDELHELVDQHKPAEVVVEIPSGKAGTGSKRGARSSLTLYGFAAGAVFGMLIRHPSTPLVVCYTERDWITASKDERQLTAAATVKGYDPRLDPGQDLSDAICLGIHHIRRRGGI